MRSLALAAAVLIALAGAAHAQGYEGNWACKTTDGNKAGLLTIYGQSYGFASVAFADPASGTGGITGYQDGVVFNDGGLKAAYAIEAGRLVPHETAGVAMQLEAPGQVLLVCTQR